MTTLRPILLVEDSAADIELTLVALKRAGSTREIVAVRDGVEALDYIFSEAGYAGRSPGPPAVILLDLKLPKINGLEVLERIKRDPIHRDIPIVMLTSSRQTSDIARSYRSGVNSYVVKLSSTSRWISQHLHKLFAKSPRTGLRSMNRARR